METESLESVEDALSWIAKLPHGGSGANLKGSASGGNG